MRPVGFNQIEAVLAPVLDPPEPALSELAMVNGANSSQVRDVIRKYIKPYYDSFDDQSRKVIADSILYFSHAPSLPETIPLDVLPTPFELTQKIDELCAWLATELCIDNREFDFRDCEYSEDLSVVHRLTRDKPPVASGAN